MEVAISFLLNLIYHPQAAAPLAAPGRHFRRRFWRPGGALCTTAYISITTRATALKFCMEVAIAFLLNLIYHPQAAAPWAAPGRHFRRRFWRPGGALCATAYISRTTRATAFKFCMEVAIAFLLNLIYHPQAAAPWAAPGRHFRRRFWRPGGALCATAYISRTTRATAFKFCMEVAIAFLLKLIYQPQAAAPLAAPGRHFWRRF